MTIGVTITGTAGSLTHTAMVNLTVSGSSTQPALSVTPSTLSFRFSGGSTPSSQKIAIADPPGVVSFTASATGGSWLSVTPGSGSTPGSVTVSVNPSRLSSGTYTGAIQLSATGATGVSVPVTLTVSSSTCIDDCGSGGSGGGSTGSMTAQPYANDPNFSGTVTSIWIEHLGMPSGSQSHDPGLVLSKNAGAPSGTWAGATIKNATGSLTELGYDYRDGGQCTTTSPRFIVVTTDNITHVVGGCSKGTITSAGMMGWKRVRFNLADTSQTSPAITPGETVSSITLVLDLGPEAGSTAAGGLAVIDNIDVNGTFVAPGNVTRFFSDN
jgi:Viral BACON domain